MSRITTTLAAAVLLAAAFNVQAANWQRTGVANEYRDPVLVDTDTLRKTPTGWTYWVSIPLRNSTNGRNVSSVMRVEADCNEGRTRTTSDIMVYGGLRGVSSDLRDNIPVPHTWSYPVPDSIAAGVMETLCNAGK